MKYQGTVTAVLASVEARSFLAEEGLPTAHELFDVLDPADAIVEQHSSGRTFLFVGVAEGVERYGIDTATGAVVAVNLHDDRVWHINASVMTFARSLDVFAQSCPFGSRGCEREEHEQAADAFRDRLHEIDPTSLREDPGFWHTLLFDIAIGDYGEEEFD